MKRIVIQPLAIALCWAIVAGQDSEQLAGQEVSLIAPAGTSQSQPEIARAYLGVTFEPAILNAAVAQSVMPGSPAEQAGLRAGDVIETLNGQRVASYEDVLDAVRWMKPGDSIDIGASRRVSIRTQAVLERAADGYQRTVDMLASPDSSRRNSVQPAAAEELLPMPAVLPNRTSQSDRQFTASPFTPRGYRTNQDVSRPENDRANQRNSRDRDSRSRRLFRGRN